MYNTYYDVAKLTLWGERKAGAPVPRLTLSFRDGNPRFVVYTGEKGVIINFPADYIIMSTVLDRLDIIANGAPGAKTTVTSLGMQYEDGKRTNKKRLVSTLHIGKNKEGIVYILVKEDGKPDIPFAFRKNEWHDFHNEAKEEFTEAEMSKDFAKAFAFLTKNALLHFLHQYTQQAYEKGQFKPGVIGGDNNGQNNNTGKRAYGSGNTEKSIAKFDDIDEDIAF